jgi:MPBQ/MSBQ methyltransferase
MTKQVTDHILEYYYKITKSDYLHYGYWNLEDELNIENLRLAQERYIDHLISFIPKDVKTILDVGCGIGGNALRLKKAGFEVEALSPDAAQAQMFKAKGEVPFYLTKFEDFETPKKYDLILMSESAQYIPIQEGLEKCCSLLNEKGNLLLSDYFIREKAEKNNVFAACTHMEDEYLKFAKEYGFEIVLSEDITSRVAPTLDFVRLKYNEYVEPTLELVDSLLQKHVSILYKVGKVIASSSLKKAAMKLELIDSKLFLKYRKYMIYLFKKELHPPV